MQTLLQNPGVVDPLGIEVNCFPLFQHHLQLGFMISLGVIVIGQGDYHKL